MQSYHPMQDEFDTNVIKSPILSPDTIPEASAMKFQAPDSPSAAIISPRSYSSPTVTTSPPVLRLPPSHQLSPLPPSAVQVDTPCVISSGEFLLDDIRTFSEFTLASEERRRQIYRIQVPRKFIDPPIEKLSRIAAEATSMQLQAKIQSLQFQIDQFSTSNQ